MKFDLLELSAFETAEEARQFAIDWQNWQSKQSLSMQEVSDYQVYLAKLAKKFGLETEFVENGII